LKREERENKIGSAVSEISSNLEDVSGEKKRPNILEQKR
jgi:hypothetical protein